MREQTSTISIATEGHNCLKLKFYPFQFNGRHAKIVAEAPWGGDVREKRPQPDCPFSRC